MTIIPAGTLDNAPSIKLQANNMWASRAAWYVHASELPTHDEYPPRK
jgi:hypothetical protein